MADDARITAEEHLRIGRDEPVRYAEIRDDAGNAVIRSDVNGDDVVTEIDETRNAFSQPEIAPEAKQRPIELEDRCWECTYRSPTRRAPAMAPGSVAMTGPAVRQERLDAIEQVIYHVRSPRQVVVSVCHTAWGGGCLAATREVSGGREDDALGPAHMGPLAHWER